MVSTTFTFWNILGIISILGLVIAVVNPMRLTARTVHEKHFHSVSVIWAPLVVLGIIGIVIALFREGDYDWKFVMKFAVIGVIIGMLGELLAYRQRSKNRRKQQ
jgi:hypothetical protein